MVPFLPWRERCGMHGCRVKRRWWRRRHWPGAPLPRRTAWTAGRTPAPS